MSRSRRVALVILLVLAAAFACEVTTKGNPFERPPAPTTPPPASPTGVRADAG